MAFFKRGLRITLGDEQIGKTVKRSLYRNGGAVREAMRDTAVEIAANIEEEGRQDIKAAGNFGSRWTEGWQARDTEGGGHIRIRVTMAVPYWTVFQTGKVIEGRPLLWIPLSFGDAVGIMARDFGEPLFRVDRLGKAPLLLSFDGKPQYFGKESVTIPKKFHLREIIERNSRKIVSTYRDHFRRYRRGG